MDMNFNQFYMAGHLAFSTCSARGSHNDLLPDCQP
jgi:hypothetical protein